MGESVKLANGNYIDTEGIWDNTQGKLQSEINNGGEIHTVNFADVYPDYFKGGVLQWIQLGRVVHVAVYSGINFKVTTATLKLELSKFGLPTPKMNGYGAAINGAKFVGAVNAMHNGTMELARTSEAISTPLNLYVSFSYVV